MASPKCQALTASGKPCKLRAGASGYCHIHDPQRMLESRAIGTSTEEQGPQRWHRFSERKGLRPVSEIIQVDGMNKDLRNSIWNVLSARILQPFKGPLGSIVFDLSTEDGFFFRLWADFFKEPIDLLPRDAEQALKQLFDWYCAFSWNEVYDFVEYALNQVNTQGLRDAMNGILERELSGYRFVAGVITDVTDHQEITMLEAALDSKDYPSVRAHLKRALELLSDRSNPDYRNSIKESISAVESLARVITGNPKATIGEALKVLERSRKIHPALQEAFSKLYGYTSDEGGIRHAMLDEPDISASDAKYFLLSCTSFINYMKSRI
jgi:hypothetical protein